MTDQGSDEKCYPAEALEREIYFTIVTKHDTMKIDGKPTALVPGDIKIFEPVTGQFWRNKPEHFPERWRPTTKEGLRALKEYHPDMKLKRDPK